ncbi:MAG: CoB--CoM heterodisulfide reductase iron-sulfur subunit A family protein [Bacteroidales bacterium]|nr:CoB--CoM heterodisulfide reductase iron-sulfur subunit A family protein [Bacteroidales bacterium]
MNDLVTTGLYFDHSMNGHPESIDLLELSRFAGNLGGVEWTEHSTVIPPADPKYFRDIFIRNRVEHLIVVGHTPGNLEPFFKKASEGTRLESGHISYISLPEWGLAGKRDTLLAKILIYESVTGQLPKGFRDADAPLMHEATLVIGGGIAGIQAALEIANSGHKVYLLERTGTIGGHMAMFDKTFPTLDCAACILTPKMVEAGQHPNIELLTYSELACLEGSSGNFRARILKKARRVDITRCIGCGVCAEKCPSKTYSEFDAGTTLRKAIYIPFPQAVPNKYLIDAEHCIYVQEGKCGVCAKVCPAECVILDDKDQEVVLEVGQIVVATGFNVFDATRMEALGYGKYPNVITSLEFERLVNASGPTGGAITFRHQDKKGNWIFQKDGPGPASIAIIHCVGSRDIHHRKYCSRVCCMYSLKMAHLIREKLPSAQVFEYYIDMRAFGKGYEEFYERIREEGVHMIRGKTATIEEKDGKLLLKTEDMLNDRMIVQEVDMVVLSVGLEPVTDALQLAGMLGITADDEGWFMQRSGNISPEGTLRGGIFLAGACQGPKDIPDTVAQASAAASGVIRQIATGRISLSMQDFAHEEIEQFLSSKSPIAEEQP